MLTACTVLSCEGIDELNEQIDKMIRAGWQPLGPCQYAESNTEKDNSWNFVITMVKYRRRTEYTEEAY